MNLEGKLKEVFVFGTVQQAADKLGISTYVIGGYVRDLIMNRPSKDIDIVCLGSGIQLAEEVASLLPDRPQVHVFKSFGTAMFNTEGLEVEFVGARKESYRSDSRKPIVEDGSIEDDQNRRDFTINALGISLSKETYGQLSDPFHGQEDIRRKIIRTPLDPDITFSDDPLRMMRAVRFATQLGFDIEPDTFDALIRNKERLKIVSMERISDELNKIILSPKPSYGFKLLFQAGLLQLIFPELVALQGVETIDNKSHKDNFYHTLQVLDNVAEHSTDLWLRWAAILHDIAKPATKRFEQGHGWTFHGHEDKGGRMVPGIFRRLKLPLNEKMDMVAKLVKLHLRPIALVKDQVTDSAVRRLLFEAGEHFEDLMVLCRADITSKNNQKIKRFLENFDKVERKVIEVEAKDSIRNFQPVVTGEDIMVLFNLKPSREVGEIKNELRDAILDGLIRNEKEEALAFVKRAGEKKGLKTANDI
ncbi:MAG TPA: HD domain-containing protein [Cytophagaceae bacterium]|jgi:tRNA nucleotidyltransferase/poly(A) polymerase|nr:HD domain-containing protein [Cytophagaceae bacterium]